MRLVVVGVLAATFASLAAPTSSGAEIDANAAHGKVCSSLSGPFCLHLGSDAAFKPYMTPVDEPSDPSPSKPETSKLEGFVSNPKRCFFRHFKRSWMDAGGEANDLMSQKVRTSDECEELCCSHPQCNSYTFWMGHTCFLRATKNVPRQDGNSFSANKLQ